MRFEKVLYHTQFGAYAFNALKSLLCLRSVGLKEVVLVHVIPRDAVGFVPYGGFLKSEERRIRKQALARFQDWQKTIRKFGIQSRIRIKTGILNAALLKIAEEEKVDLIVTGSKKRTAFEKIYVGSHILDILRRSPLPVLMGKYRVRIETDGMFFTRNNDRIFERPMLATDWSAPSERALGAIAAMKGIVRNAIIVHVLDSKLIKEADPIRAAELEKESQRRLQDYCKRLWEGEIPAEEHFAMGKPIPEILRISRETEATMILMGRTGKDWMEEYWLGGVSHRVAELSELPVMLIP